MKGLARGVIGMLVAASVALPVAASAQQPGENLRVFLVTMGPGAEIYERFGHDAIWVRDTVAQTDVIYNYGMFSFGSGSIGDELSFALRFAKGPQQYWLGADHNMDNELDLYRSRGRDLIADELNLTPAQRADIAARLATNALDANKFYAYDYFRDNCATRVRDLLDSELGGALKRATVGRPADGTLRFHTRRSITNDKLLFVGIDAAFGPRVDRPLDQWDEMFLPVKVQQRLKELSVPDGSGGTVPLIAGEYPLLTIGAYQVEPQPPHWTGVFLLIGLAISGLIRLTDSRRVSSLIGRAVGGAWMLLMGVGGVVLLGFWLFTEHVATYANHNLLLISPLALCLVPSFWYRANGEPGRWAPPIAMVVMASVAIGAILALLPAVSRQDNLLIAALVGLPTFVAALEALRRANRRAAEHRRAAQLPVG